MTASSADDIGEEEGDRVLSIAGEVTWSNTFDEAAKRSGLSDCDYTRKYNGLEDHSMPWLCPGCDAVFRVDVELVRGSDCYDTLDPDPPPKHEWLGYGNGILYRAHTGTVSEQGTAIVDGKTIEWTNFDRFEPLEGGQGIRHVSGVLTLGETYGDPQHGFVPPQDYEYECGWPRSEAPRYDGNYEVKVGAPLPDGVFPDTCEQLVRLHDFAGNYLVVEMAAMDCSACQWMASGQAAFVQDMAEEGIEVVVITLMAASLGSVGLPAPAEDLQLWADYYDITGPMLGDRLWGKGVFGFGSGYPTWAVVAPDLTVLDTDTGTRWDAIRESIVEHSRR